MQGFPSFVFLLSHFVSSETMIELVFSLVLSIEMFGDRDTLDDVEQVDTVF